MIDGCNMTKKARLSDFRSRCADDVEVLRLRDSEYIPIHPFADDQALLERIGWQSEKCISVDAYWRVTDDVVFLQMSTKGSSGRAVGRYARWREGEGGVNLSVVVDAPTISRAVFEAEMTRLLDDGVVEGALHRGRSLGNSLVAV
jgi:hypothetical protein